MMKHSLILFSMVSLILASAASGAVRKGEAEFEVLGGLTMESGADEGSDQDSILEGATGADLDGWFVSGGFGRFASDNLQISLVGFGEWMDGSETPTLVIDPGTPEALLVYDVDVDATVYGIGGRIRWHLSPEEQLVPYVGIQALWATADVDISGTAAIVISGVPVPGSEDPISENDSASGMLWGPVVGLRLQLGETDDLLLEYQYRLWAGSISDILDTGHAFSIGLAHRLN